MSVDTNAWELAVLTSSTAGFLIQTFLLWKIRRVFYALKGSRNGRRQVAWFHATSGLGLLYAHSVFIYYGIRLVTLQDPPAYTTELVVNLALFVGISFVLVLIGLNDLRLSHNLRKGTP